MNKIILIGRLVRDPELRYTPNGAAVCTFTLAVDRPYNSQSNEREADFIDIVVWNKIAENVAKYITKGRQVGVEGRLQIRSYEANDGQRRWRTEVIANQVEFLGSGGGGERMGQGMAPTSQPAPSEPSSSFGTEVSFSDGDIPF